MNTQLKEQIIKEKTRLYRNYHGNTCMSSLVESENIREYIDNLLNAEVYVKSLNKNGFLVFIWYDSFLVDVLCSDDNTYTVPATEIVYVKPTRTDYGAYSQAQKIAAYREKHGMRSPEKEDIYWCSGCGRPFDIFDIVHEKPEDIECCCNPEYTPVRERLASEGDFNSWHNIKKSDCDEYNKPKDTFKKENNNATIPLD
jgi:hypothetical protein